MQENEEPVLPVEGDDQVDWVRGGREADLTNVDAHKLVKAAKERGIRVDLTESGPGKRKGKVYKVEVEGMPGPFSWFKRLFRKKPKPPESTE